MALRAGYGIYYDFENLLGFDQFAANTPYGLNYQPQPPSSVVDPYQGQQLFPYVVPVPEARICASMSPRVWSSGKKRVRVFIGR